MKLGNLIRTGSGFIINNLSHHKKDLNNIYFGIDLNYDACLVTKIQSDFCKTNVNVINSNGLRGLNGLKNKVDIMIFNPV